jgi:amino acid transporter
MHASVLVLSFIGVAVAFVTLRRRLPSAKAASLFGVVFAVLSFFFLVAAFATAGFWGAGAWLLVGSIVLAFLSGLLGKPHEG